MARAAVAEPDDAATAEAAQALVDLYCAIRHTDTICKSSLGVLRSFARQHGHERLEGWLHLAQSRIPWASESRFIRYLSGIRRTYVATGHE